jgi:hypothetical protein
MNLKSRLRGLERQFRPRENARLPPPDLVTVYYRPLFDAEGHHIYGGERCDSMRASVGYGEGTTFYDRNEGESLDDFKRRVIASHPRGRFPRAITLWPIEPAV